MSKLTVGTPTKHVLASRGPNINRSHFYVTEYSTNHGKEGYLPRRGRHTGTGYLSNFRPGVYYNRKIDELDNPGIGKLLKDNYDSSYQSQFNPYQGSNGTDKIRNEVFVAETGFNRNIPPTLPSSHNVQTVCYNPSYDHNIKMPKSKLYLVRNPNDPIEKENNYYGASFMSTENKSRFRWTINSNATLCTKNVNSQGDSSFSHPNYEPVTFRALGNFQRDGDVFPTCRPTGQSIMQESFQPLTQNDSCTSFKLLTKRAERNTGYTREIQPRPGYSYSPSKIYTTMKDVHPSKLDAIQKNDPAEHFNMKYVDRFPSMTGSTFCGAQQSKAHSIETIHNSNRKEDTGYTGNNRSVQSFGSSDLPGTFNTHYKLAFSNKNPEKLESCRNTMPLMNNGFTKSTQVHQHSMTRDVQNKWDNLHPYVAKSIAANNPYFFNRHFVTCDL